LLFPFGNNSQDTVSIYLDFVDIKGAPPDWHSCAQFALVLWNPEDPTQYISHRMYKINSLHTHIVYYYFHIIFLLVDILDF
jgi:hypothetical protein